MTISPSDLTRHAAFLGAPGSGKTTAALCVVEQLLLKGIPAILVDRKGDLCSYARPDMGLREGVTGELADRAARLRATVDVALFTPRRSDGRPLSIFDTLVQDLEFLRLNHGDMLSAAGEPLEIEALLGLGAYRSPGKTRLSIISTKFLGTNQDVQFWVAQFLMTLGRWISQSPASSGSLQAVVLFDEADLYLPAVRQPATKEPMEHLLKRARSAGLGLLLATQSPGDFDYKCRDNIRAWFVGQVKEANSIAKMKPMLNDCRIDVAALLPSQEPGEFHLIRDGEVTGLKTSLSAVDPRQVSEEEIVSLARQARKG